MDIKPIETKYKGYRFRSRAEARHAVLLDNLGIPYRYEDEGFDLDGRLYLPDFWLPTLHVWLEVKGKAPTDDERQLAYKLSSKSRQAVLISYGSLLPVPMVDGDDRYLITDDASGIEVFAGEAWHSWPLTIHAWHFRCWETRFEDGDGWGLRAFLKDKMPGHEMPDSSNTEDARRRLVELDCLYFRQTYGKEHPTYRFGRSVYTASGDGIGRSGLWATNKNGDYVIDDVLTDPRIAAAYAAARSARFEHGETP